MIVVDTTVLVYAVRPGEHTEAALQAKELDPDWVAPSFWRLEMRNVLTLSMRLDGMDLATAIAAFDAAEDLVEDLDFEPTTREVLELTQSAGISAYDAEFVLAARQFDLRLVTADRRLARSVPQVCVQLAEFVSR